ncbi:MAG: 2-oxoacid:acceptor oxidoreductase family protein [Conexivisphaerales archaeon]|jgi:indolepyruvate ferredoxin oxidoreductase
MRAETENKDFLTIPDIGCYSMSMYGPWREAHAFNAMGHAGASADAMKDVINKKLVLIGDGTFEHGGKNSVQEAIDGERDRVTIIMDNKCVAMTGHQESITTEFRGKEKIQSRKFEPIIKGMAGSKEVYIKTINPDDRRGYVDELKKAFRRQTPTVFVSEKECGITKERRRKMLRKGPKTEFVNVTPEVCENCRECTMNTGCPGLALTDTIYGQKVAIDMSICTEDVYCAKIEACPSFERVKVSYANGVPRERLTDAELGEIPEPAKKVDFDDMYSIYTGSFGGMGGGLNTVVLARAAAKQGYNKGQWIGHDKKGLAVRNGGVYSHVIFQRSGVNISPVISAGHADLINGLDKLEGTRGMKYANESTIFVSNETALPTIPMLTGEEDYPDDIDDRIRGKVGKDDYFGLPVSELTEFYLGSKIYSNMVMLGMTYQLGLLPLELRNLEDSIVQSAKAGKSTNIKAFRLGRKLVADKGFSDRLVNNPDFLLVYNEKEWFSRITLEGVIKEKREYLRDYYFLKSRGEKAAEQYQALVESVAKSGFDAPDVKELAVRVYDLARWGNFAYAKSYVDKVLKVYASDDRDEGFKATKAVLYNLYKVMAIKDELWVAELLLAKEKLNRDRVRYNINPSRGDSVKYVHLNRPQLDIYVGGVIVKIVKALKKRVPNPTRKRIEIDVSKSELKVRFDMNTSTFSLRSIRRLKFLRGAIFRHKKEEGFRDWYAEEVVGQFLTGAYKDYDSAVKALSIPLELSVPNHVKGVTGFRDIIYPKMELAKYVYAASLKPTKDVPQILDR